MIATTLLMSALIPGWTLVWSDEFDYKGHPDPKKWGFEKGYLRNGEKQYYTDRLENARVENGHLVIEARKDNWEGKPITSASVTTDGIASWTYGKVEVRAKIPTGRGTWPAIWMLGDNIDKVGWPMCGELDIMENVGFDPQRIHANIHTKAFNHSIGTNKGNSVVVDAPWKEFHVYGLEWFKDRIDFFLDGKKYFTFDKPANATEAEWPFDKPQYLIINFAFGGSWGGSQGVDESILPARYEIDYARVYKAN